MRVLLLLLFFGNYLYCQSSSSPYLISDQQAVFELDIARKLMLVQAKINDKEGWFIIDTGAPDLILNSNYCSDLFASPKAEKYLDIDGMKNDMQQVYIDQFVWGAVERHSFWATKTNLNHLEALIKRPLLGLIGYEVYRNYEMIIEYHQQKLTLVKLDRHGYPVNKLFDRPADHIFPFQQKRHLILLEANVMDSDEMVLALDSGASINLLDKDWQKKLQEHARGQRQIAFSGVGAKTVSADFWAFPALVVAQGIVFKWWKAAFTDLEHFCKASVNIDGFLGINFFQLGTTIINYQRQEVLIWEEVSGFSHRYRSLK